MDSRFEMDPERYIFLYEKKIIIDFIIQRSESIS